MCKTLSALNGAVFLGTAVLPEEMRRRGWWRYGPGDSFFEIGAAAWGAGGVFGDDQSVGE